MAGMDDFIKKAEKLEKKGLEIHQGLTADSGKMIVRLSASVVKALGSHDQNGEIFPETVYVPATMESMSHFVLLA